VRSSAFLLGGLVLCLVLSSGAWGDSITIQNPSFEITAPLVASCGPPDPCLFNFTTPPGWTPLPVGSGFGSFEPSSAFFSLPLPDGNIVAYTNSGAISQTLAGISLLPNSIYTLSVDVGRRFDVVAATYSMSLLDGTNVFCSNASENLSNGSFIAGTFVDVTLTCATGASVPSGFLGIELAGAGRQIDFDNVRLDVVTNPTSTPEPGASLLVLAGLGVICLLVARSRRNQHLQGASS
jgi:hypothetical protein